MESGESTPPAWRTIAGWVAAAAALVFVAVGAIFLQPKDERAIQVNRPVDAGAMVAAADRVGTDRVSEVASSDFETAGGLDAPSAELDDDIPANLSFVDDDAAPPPLVEPSPLENPTLEGDQAGFSDPFETVGPPWTALAGSWVSSGGRLVQQDIDNFDLMVQLERDVPESYRLTVVMAPMSGPLSAGVLIGQQNPGERAGAYLVDFADDGTFVRFGRYAEADAAYEYLEGLPVPVGFDPAATHELSLVVEPNETTVVLDGEYLTTFGPASAGRVGLVTNRAATGFDDFVLEPI